MASYVDRMMGLASKSTRNIFGRDSVYHEPDSGPQHVFVGVFTGAYERLSMDGDTVVSTTSPSITVRLDDLPVAPLQYGHVDVADIGKRYMVLDVQPGEVGTARLILGRAVAIP